MIAPPPDTATTSAVSVVSPSEIWIVAPGLNQRPSSTWIVPVSSRHRSRLDRHVTRLTEAGIPSALAHAVARTRFLLIVFDAIEIGRAQAKPPEQVLRLRLAVSDAMRMSELQSAISRMELVSTWDGPAVLSLGRQLEFHAHKMTLLVKDDDIDGMISTYGLANVQKLIGEYLEGDVTVASLVMLDGQLRRLLPPMRGA